MTKDDKTVRGNLKGLNSLGWKIHDHLMTHRPKMYQDLETQDRLEQYLLDRQNEINRQLTFLEHQGMYPHEAWEMLRDEIYLPSEEDVPNLGETLRPYTD